MPPGDGLEILEVRAIEEIKADSIVNPLSATAVIQKAKAMEQKLKGSAGTLHVTKEEDKHQVIDLAWSLSKQTKLPVVIVVRGS